MKCLKSQRMRKSSLEGVWSYENSSSNVNWARTFRSYWSCYRTKSFRAEWNRSLKT